MKVGILTFHCANNYGAVLQCYALQEYLSSLGHEAYVIDYRPGYVVRRYKVFSRRNWIVRDFKKTIKKLLSEPYLCIVRYKRNKRLESFIKNRYNLYPYSADKSVFDAIVLGSDQIWNPNLTGKSFDEVFFGNDFHCKKISYAASNRTESLSPAEEAFYIKHLAELDSIGVREKTLQALLQPLTTKKVHLNVDPTLLSDKSWTNKLNLTKPLDDEYIMLYEVTRHQKNRCLAMEYANRNKYSFVELTGALALSVRHTKYLDQTASPEKFLSYLKYAKCVFTTSFHGTALSILFEKEFFYIRQYTSSDLRIESLLGILGLKERILDRGETPQAAPIDYSNIHNNLEAFRKESVQYLKEALKD